MKYLSPQISLGLAALLLLGATTAVLAAAPATGTEPDSWNDPKTGHQIVRISRLKGKSATSFYFNQTAFTDAGDKMVFMSSDGLYTVEMPKGDEVGSLKTIRIAEVKGLVAFPIVAPISRQVFYLTRERTILGTDIDTGKSRVVCTLPEDWDLAPESISGLTLNSDETLLCGVEKKGLGAVFATGKTRGDKIKIAYEAHLPTFLFTVNTKNGDWKRIYGTNEWLNHTQFSPTKPKLLLFCHEGPWQKLDRIWLIQSDGSVLINIHPRKMADESYGHEFWSADGTTVWSDHYVPGNRNRFLNGYNASTGAEVEYVVQRDWLSRHYNISHDGKFFAGDGEPINPIPMIRLFIPQPDGTLKAENLCSIAKNNFNSREPNVMFTRDDKWIIFMSTQTGTSQIYAVKVAK